MVTHKAAQTNNTTVAKIIHGFVRELQCSMSRALAISKLIKVKCKKNTCNILAKFCVPLSVLNIEEMFCGFSCSLILDR